MQHKVPLAHDALIGYLTTCGGSDSYTCWSDDGQPDLGSARALAEQLRHQLGDQLDVVATVDQSFNRVTMSLVLEIAKI